MAEGVGEEAAVADRPTVFISYASQDAAVANAVVGVLERAGLACWIAPRDVVPGALYADEIVRAINDASFVVLVLSAQSVASPHVGKELERASSKRRRIIALRTDAAALPRAFEYFLSESQWIEVGAGGIEPAATKLAEAVRRHLGAEPVIEPHVAPAASKPYSQVSTRRWRGIPVGVTVVAVLALLLIAGGIQWMRMRVSSTHSSQTAQESVSLAVLPFVDMSPGHDQDYFSDGLSEELLNQLAQIKDLRLTARTSSFSFKGRNEDVRVIGEKLGVGNILEGSVRKDGNHLRVTAQLINSRDGTHLWSQTYDRELSAVFALQEEIAMAVSGALSVTLDVGEMSRAKGGTTNVESYDKYLRARKVRSLGVGQENEVQAIELYREALALDPKFARAWNGLYDTLSESLIYMPENSAAARKEMADASAHIVALAPDAWWTQAMRADQFVAQRRWSEAEGAGSAALAAASASDVDAVYAYSIFLWPVGRSREAADLWARLRQTDPLSLRVSYIREIALTVIDRPDEAQAEHERGKHLSGDHQPSDEIALWRDLQLLKETDSPTVRAQVLQYLQHSSSRLDRNLGNHLGSKEAARAALHKEFEDPENQTATGMSDIAIYAVSVGDKDLALAALERSYVQFGGTNAGMIWAPMFSSLRGDPRFKNFLLDMKLVDYFRASGKWGDFCKPVGKDDFECH